jgi:hypothetical protein
VGGEPDPAGEGVHPPQRVNRITGVVPALRVPVAVGPVRHLVLGRLLGGVGEGEVEGVEVVGAQGGEGGEQLDGADRVGEHRDGLDPAQVVVGVPERGQRGGEEPDGGVQPGDQPDRGSEVEPGGAVLRGAGPSRPAGW